MEVQSSTNRKHLLARLSASTKWDLVVIGGGATGVGIALDAASRGHSVVLLEARDFAKGTSSRATKLLHGGVRYLGQGNFRLVHEALRERAVILRNAPHLAQRLAFVIPTYRRWDQLFYGIGLTVYAALSGGRSLGRTEWLGAEETIQALPNIRREGLVGGVRYWDAQFDDARLALALARTAAKEGALVVNYFSVEELIHSAGQVSGVRCKDNESGQSFELLAGCVINATGVWADGLRMADCQATESKFKERVQPSRGTHLVLDSSFLPSAQALMVPKTSDGRVLFAIPWQGKLLAGTTDAPAVNAESDPRPMAVEVDFVLRELGGYLEKKPLVSDVLSTWAGLRPLIRPDSGDVKTKAISREHDIAVSKSGLVTVTGGKWTTYRVIACDTLESCYSAGLLTGPTDCRTADLHLVGAPEPNSEACASCYGTDLEIVRQLPGADVEICPGFTEAMVRFAVRHEFARTVDDILARRVRLLFLDARLAAKCARRVAEILLEETGGDPALQAFLDLVGQYSGQGSSESVSVALGIS